jgi:hypothetical protein
VSNAFQVERGRKNNYSTSGAFGRKEFETKREERGKRKDKHVRIVTFLEVLGFP